MRIRYSVDLMHSGGGSDSLDGVESGQLDWSYAAKLTSGGKLTVADTGQDIDWFTDRVAVSIAVDDADPQQLGLFIPSHQGGQWSQGHRSWDLELHSPLLAIDQFASPNTGTFSPGEKVVPALRTLLDALGERPVIEDSTETIKHPMAWEPGTSMLVMCNDLLSAIGYSALSIDSAGNIVAGEYTAPADRPVRHAFADGDNCTYVGDFTDSVDIFSIPNRVIAIGKGDGDTEGLIGSADNTDAHDPLSIPNRQRIIAKVYTDVEATSQAAINRYAKARLAENASPRNTVEIKHAPMPDLYVTQAVSFTYSPGGIDDTFVVDKTSISLDPSALQTTTLRKV